MFDKHGTMNSMSQRSVYESIQRFKSERTSAPDNAPSGRSTMLHTQDHTDSANTLI